MKKNKKYLLIAATAVLLIIAGMIYSFPSISGMFKLNKQLQEEGYYMAEFEFKMLGIVYYLDRGNYVKALSRLYKVNDQLKSREGFIKLPVFKNKQEEMEFYLNLQNPNTGAFMDESYPFCTYTGPTGNVLNHLDALARETGRPLKLKYPLKYLDEINTPEKLKKYLDDVSTVGWLGSRFPQTSFHFTRCLLSLFHEDNVVEKRNLYKVSPEWDRALLKWFYDNQDPATGLWGPRSESGKLIKKDTMNTGSILKIFIDEEGNNIYKNFPLRYRNELAGSTLEESLNEPVPGDDDLDEWHEWNLKTAKAIRTATRYLWDGLSEETRAKTKKLTEHYIRTKFEKFYVKKEGAFSYYPGAEHATLDGTSGILGTFKDLGCFSKKKYIRLWGKSDVNGVESGNLTVPEISESDLKNFVNSKDANSIRFYAVNPEAGDYTANVLGVFYPRKTSVLDVMELVPGMRTWINGTSQSMGNWVSKEDILQSLSEIKFETIPVLKSELPLNELNNVLLKYKKITVIGFDILQTPVCRISYTLR